MILILLLLLGLILAAIIEIITPLLPALGGAFGAIVAYLLVSHKFEEQEREKIRLKNEDLISNNAKALKEEISYIKRKLGYINCEYPKICSILKDPTKMGSVEDNLKKMRKFIDQIRPHYSIDKFIIFHSIGKDLGNFGPELVKNIIDIYYELDLWYLKYGDIISNNEYDVFVPNFFKDICMVNEAIITNIDNLNDELDKLTKC